MSDEVRGLYRFEYPSYNCVRGMFTATAAEVAGMVGKMADFGDADGKHSHVEGVIKASHFKLVTTDIAFVTKFDEYRCRSGASPRCAIESYIENQQDQDDDGAE